MWCLHCGALCDSPAPRRRGQSSCLPAPCESACVEEPREVGGQQLVDQPSLLDVEGLDPTMMLPVDETQRSGAEPEIPGVVALQVLGVAGGRREQGGMLDSRG